MKWFLFSLRIFSVLFVLLLEEKAIAEDAGNKRSDRWKSFLPTHVKFQYAGSMGLVSAGPGWQYGKKKQWETSMMLGYVPKYVTSKAKACFTLKQLFIPWDLTLKNDFSFEPLSCGFYVTAISGDEFWARNPSQNPNGYYWFQTRLRYNICLGESLTYHISQTKKQFIKAISFYYEISTNDLYMNSAFTNRYLKPEDYLHLAFGVKLQW